MRECHDTGQSKGEFDMRFIIRNFFAASLLILASASFAQVEPEIHLRITNVRGNVYMVDDVKGEKSSAGGNVGVVIGEDGVVLIDSLLKKAAPKIPDVLKTVTDRAVRFVIGTHVHPDHVGGFVFFGPTATLIAHENTYAAMSTKTDPAASWPVITVADHMTLRQNGETLELRHYPRAHTNTDLVVFYKKANVVQMGDNYFSGMFPFVADDGHIDGVIAVIEDVLAKTNADTKFIPGHGPLSTRADLSASLAMIKETRAIAADGMKRGLTVEQLVDAKILARFEPWSHGYIDTKEYFEEFYKVLERRW
jgi:glyoxylase-like metal-dependent hydrolase (beta-lactamase superfamily II)